MDYDNNNDEISLSELFALLRKGFLWAVTVGLLFGLSAFVITRRMPKEYAASAQLLLTLPADQLSRYADVALVTANAVDPSAYIAAVKSTPIVQQALIAVGALEDTDALTEAQYEQVLEFSSRLTVQSTVERLSSIITLKMTGHDSDYVSQEVNSLANALLAWDTQRATRSLNQVIATLEQQIFGIQQQLELLESNAQLQNINTGIQNTDTANNPVLQTNALSRASTSISATNAPSQEEGRIQNNTEYIALQNLQTDRINQVNSLRSLSDSAVGFLEVIELSHPSRSPVAPRVLFSTLIALILGGFLGYVVYFIRASLTGNIDNVELLQRVTGLPIIGEFDRIPMKSTNLPREQVRYLRTNIILAMQDITPKVMLVTSDNPSQGKSTVSRNLAESFVLGDYKVLLVDADMRKPSLHKHYRYQFQSNNNDIVNHLSTQGTMHEPVKVQLSAKHTFDFIPCFTPNDAAPELLAHGIRPCLRRWQQNYDVIIIDSAPLLAVADSMIIAPHTNATLLVTSLVDAKQSTILHALELLKRIGTNIIGNVVTNVSRDNRQTYQYIYGDKKPKRQAS